VNAVYVTFYPQSFGVGRKSRLLLPSEGLDDPQCVPLFPRQFSGRGKGLHDSSFKSFLTPPFLRFRVKLTKYENLHGV